MVHIDKILESADLDVGVYFEIYEKLRELSADNQARLHDMATVIKAEASLANAVLKLANSPAFYLSTPTSSIESALARIGVQRSLNICLIAIQNQIINNKITDDNFRRSLWLRSLYSATLARKIATNTHRSDADGFYSGGLLSTLGEAIFFSHYQEISYPILSDCNNSLLIQIELEQKAFGVNHAQLSGLLLRKWRFPSEITNALESQCEWLYGVADINSGIILLSNLCARFITTSHLYENEIEIPLHTPSQALWSSLNLTSHDVHGLLNATLNEVDCINQQLGFS